MEFFEDISARHCTGARCRDSGGGGIASALQSGASKKKAAVVDVVGAAINIADAVSSRNISPTRRSLPDGLSTVIDGVVACLNRQHLG